MDEPPELPRVVVALGDSITRAANAAGPGERPASSWATGHDARDGVSSFAERLVLEGADLSGNVHNFARSGASVADLPRQADLAVEANADLVLVLVGANDVCRASVEEMTSVDEFRASVREAGTRLRAGLPEAVVMVVSFPDVGVLWDLGKESPSARERWRDVGVCPALLGEGATEEERDAVRERGRELNAALMEEAEALGFATDGLAVFRAGFEPAHVSSFDHFHPSLAGQAALAEAAWAASPYVER